MPDPSKTMNDIINSIKAHECEICKTGVSVGLNIAEGIADPEAEAEEIMYKTARELNTDALCHSPEGLATVDEVTERLFHKKIENECLKENVCKAMYSGNIVAPIKQALVTEACIGSNACTEPQCL